MAVSATDRDPTAGIPRKVIEKYRQKTKIEIICSKYFKGLPRPQTVPLRANSKRRPARTTMTNAIAVHAVIRR